MGKNLAVSLALALMVLAPPLLAQDDAVYEPFSPDRLDNLLAPIALYPDPLLAQVAFPDQVDQAVRFVPDDANADDVDGQPWDVGVKENGRTAVTSSRSGCGIDRSVRVVQTRPLLRVLDRVLEASDSLPQIPTELRKLLRSENERGDDQNEKKVHRCSGWWPTIPPLAPSFRHLGGWW
jgi:hypothetical protein